jgi:fructose-1,6-bisphosphatase/inositol monophosphatase family enzyme
MQPDAILEVLDRAGYAVHDALEGFSEKGYSGLRDTQYKLDLVADEAVLNVLLAAGIAVVSEESGRTGAEGGLVCVVDPIDGSTNCDHGVPFFSTSLCVLDDDGPLVGYVRNQATGVTYRAVRGGGATRDGQPISPSGTTNLSEAIIAFSGLPTQHYGWAQYRALGAASLEMCLVADGSLDGYLQAGYTHINPWDYLAALLICREAGAVVEEHDDLDLIVAGAAKRRPVVAANAALAAQLRLEATR